MLDPIPTLEPRHDNSMVPFCSSLSAQDYILIPTLTEHTPLLERPPSESQPCPKGFVPNVCTSVRIEKTFPPLDIYLHISLSYTSDFPFK